MSTLAGPIFFCHPLASFGIHQRSTTAFSFRPPFFAFIFIFFTHSQALHFCYVLILSSFIPKPFLLLATPIFYLRPAFLFQHQANSCFLAPFGYPALHVFDVTWIGWHSWRICSGYGWKLYQSGLLLYYGLGSACGLSSNFLDPQTNELLTLL